MVTAADGAVQFYTAENNEARYETVDEAKDLDKKLINGATIIATWCRRVWLTR